MAGLAAAWLLAAGLAAAQVPLESPAKPSTSTTPAKPAQPSAAESLPKPTAVEETGPATYYLRNKDGELVPVPGMTLEQFERLMKLDLKLAVPGPPLPSYTLSELTIQGTADAAGAQMQVEVAVRLQRDGWVAVPLAFSQAILRQPAEHEGDGEFFLTYSRDEGGFMAWLQGTADSLHRVKLNLHLPVREVGGEFRLAMQAPRATTSLLELQVPLPAAKATVNSGLLETKPRGNETLLSVTGLSADLQLAWRQGGAARSEAGPLLDVRSDILVQIEGERVINSDATLRVRSLRGEFDSFLVRLPKYARLASPGKNGVGIAAVEVAEAADAAEAGRLVSVKLDRKTTETVEVRLLTYMSAPEEVPQPEFDLDGFGVVNAIRQSGTIDFSVSGDWAVDWTEGRDVRRVLALPETASTSSKIAARFEFIQQPFSLKFKVARKQTRISVEPTYILFLEANRARLEAILKYRVRGAEAFGVNVDMAGWRLESAAPETLIDREKLNRDKLDPLFVPLSAMKPREDGDFELRLVASQDWADTESGLAVTLPQPQADSATPASVIVVPADNVQLSIDPERLVGLDRDTLPPEVVLPPRQQPPHFFRQANMAAPAVFAAKLAKKKRAVVVRAQTDVAIVRQRVQVVQRFEFGISHEPLQQVGFWIPKVLFDSAAISFSVNDQPLEIVEWTDPAAAKATTVEPAAPTVSKPPPPDAAEADDVAKPSVAAKPATAPAADATAPKDVAANPASKPTPNNETAENKLAATELVRVGVELPAAVIGDLTMIARFDLPLPAPLTQPSESSSPESFRLPLIAPRMTPEIALADNRLLVTADENRRAIVEPGPWQPSEPLAASLEPANGSETPTAVHAAGVVQEAVLRLSLLPQRRATNMVVTQMWIQSWLSPTTRRDRAVFRLTGSEPSLSVQLPAGAVLEEAAIDGRRITFAPDGPGRATLALPNAALGGREIVVELWYAAARVSSGWGQTPLPAPRIDGADWTRRVFWQIVLPPSEHLLLGPANLSPELQWRRRGLLWYREPALDQATLERWIGATKQDPLPPAAHAYLFSSLGEIDAISLTAAPRLWITLFLSSLVLAAGLSLIYLPALRHPAVLLIGSVAILSVALWQPPLAVFAAQAAWLGIGLIALARLLKWLLDLRLRRGSVIRGTTGAGPDSKATRLLPRGDSHLLPTTTAAVLPLQFSAEPKP